MDLDKYFMFKPEFIQKLKDNPEEALPEIGIEPTPELLEALRAIDIDALMNLMKVHYQSNPHLVGMAI